MGKQIKKLSHANKILNFMKRKKVPLSAYEILDGLATQGITAPTTVYRALNKLVNDKLIHKIESLNTWTLCCGSHQNNMPIFEISKNCGNVTEHLDSNLTKTIRKLSERSGFSADNSVFEIHGQCGDCTVNHANN